MTRSFAKRSSASPSADAGDESAMRFAAGLRYPGPQARQGHIESWFLKANDPRSRRALWLRWTLWASERAPTAAIAEVWAVAFGADGGPVAAKAGVPYGGGLAGGQANCDRQGLGVAIDGCTLTPERAKGRVETGGRVIAYDLKVTPLAESLLHFASPWMYSPMWPWQKIASPVPSALFSGLVEVAGESWAVDGWPGMIGHNWGRRHAPLYAWGQCSTWDEHEGTGGVDGKRDGGDDLVLEGFSVGAGGPILGATLLCVRYQGVRHDLNGLRALARNAGAITPRRWRFRGRSPGLDIDGELWAETEDMVGLHYPNPDGTHAHCLNSELARAEVTMRVKGGANGGKRGVARTFRSSRAALEIGTHDPHHGVRMVL